MKETVKKLILDQIRLHGGISNFRLWINITGLVNPVMITSHEYHDAIDELVNSKDILKLEFTDEQSHSNPKQVFFMRGTRFTNLRDFISEKTEDATEEAAAGKGQLVK